MRHECSPRSVSLRVHHSDAFEPPLYTSYYRAASALNASLPVAFNTFRDFSSHCIDHLINPSYAPDALPGQLFSLLRRRMRYRSSAVYGKYADTCAFSIDLFYNLPRSVSFWVGVRDLMDNIDLTRVYEGFAIEAIIILIILTSSSNTSMASGLVNTVSPVLYTGCFCCDDHACLAPCSSTPVPGDLRFVRSPSVVTAGKSNTRSGGQKTYKTSRAFKTPLGGLQSCH